MTQQPTTANTPPELHDQEQSGATPLNFAAVEVPPEAVKATPVKVLVVDDEVFGMDRSHLRQLEPGAEALLGDSGSPEVEEIIAIAKQFMDVSQFAGDDAKTADFLASDELVRVLVSPAFFEKAPAALKKHFSNFLSKVEKVKELRNEIELAFPSPEYELIFKPSRISVADALLFDLVVLDLVLKGSGSPVDELVSYLKDFSLTAANLQLPPVIIMSTHPELREHRKNFGRKASISAAGLWILPKADLVAPDFKARGLKLVFEQLSRQRSVAHRMRIFLRGWTAALDNARDKAASTLWNLDASAMQRIHHTAIKDNDPYDDHLGELLAREYLWHVESDRSVGDAIKELDTCFRKEMDPIDFDKIKYRFMAPLVDPDVTRGLFSRFTWLGWPNIDAFYGGDVANSLAEFNTRVPFGSVLASELVDGGECLIHITQQCDLNAATRPKPEQRSAVFATAIVHEAFPHRLTNFQSQDLVARGLLVGGKEFDLKFVQSRTLAIPIPDFLQKAEREGLKVFGRLRHDIATHFVQATANQLTRPASFVMAREGSFEAKLFLKGEKFPGKQSVAYLDAEQKGRIVRVVRDGTSYSFQDDESVRIAIWLERQMREHYEGGDENLANLSNTLRLGQKLQDPVVAKVNLAVFPGELAKAYITVATITPAKDGVTMALIVDHSKFADQK